MLVSQLKVVVNFNTQNILLVIYCVGRYVFQVLTIVEEIPSPTYSIILQCSFASVCFVCP